MAVSKAITKCVPYVNSSSKVDKWDIEMTYTCLLYTSPSPRD